MSYSTAQGIVDASAESDCYFVTAPDIPLQKQTFRKKDEVKVIRARTVQRVGYAKRVEDYKPGIRAWWEEQGELIRQLQNSLGVTLRQHATAERMIDVLAYAKARADRFGGPDRGVVLRDRTDPFFATDTFIVTSTRQKRVGSYYPPQGGWDGYWGRSDYEPGGLVQARTIVICTLDNCFDVLSGDLEMVKAAKPSRAKPAIVKPDETDTEVGEP